MDTLAKRIVKARQALPGMTKDFLREAILGTIDGVLIGWYSADKAQCPETKISHEQAIAGLRALVSARSSMSRAWFSPKRSESVQIAFELE